jgi:hypothetical protein
VPTFLLSGPYASAEETAKIDSELVRLLQILREAPSIESSGHRQPFASESLSGLILVKASEAVSKGKAGTLYSQRVTAADKASGIIRFPKPAKVLFPSTMCEVEVVFRGVRVRASYDPRNGPDRERSAVLRMGRERLLSVTVEEMLSVNHNPGGAIYRY